MASVDVIVPKRNVAPAAEALARSSQNTVVDVVQPGKPLTKDVFVIVPQPTVPSTVEPVNVGLVEISQFTGQKGREGPPGQDGVDGAPGTTFVGDTAPASPILGQLWWESDLGNLLIWYDDGTSQQWVAANTPGPAGPPGAVGPVGPPGTGEGSLAVSFVGPDPPVAPVPGSLWWESDSGQMFIYYQDINSTQWVPTSIGVPGAGVTVMAERIAVLEARIAALEGSSP